jgi:hypothetical protein
MSAAGRTTLAVLLVLAAGCTRKVQFRDDAIGNESGQFNRGVRNDFASERFDKLEAVASQIIVERSRFPTGSWKIVQFHWAITPSRAPGTHWDWYESHFKDWEEKFPLSATAHIAHARFLTAYAWAAQDSDPDNNDASNIKEFAQPLFSERMAQANEQLTIAGQLDQKSPEFWFTGLDVALGQGWSKQATKAWFNAGKAAYPDFWGMDASYFHYLLPGWHGQPGEWERAALEEIHRPGGLGLEGYARNVLKMELYYVNVLRDSTAQWPLVREGFFQMRKRYPDSQLLSNEFALMAVLAEDRDTGAPLFKKIGIHADPNVWSSVAEFKQYRAWMYGGKE